MNASTIMLRCRQENHDHILIISSLTHVMNWQLMCMVLICLETLTLLTVSKCTSGKDYIRCDAKWICIVIIKLIDVKHKDPDIIMMFSATLNQAMNQCLNAWNPQQKKKISINYPVSPICPSPANVNTIFWPIINSTLLVNTAAPSKQTKTNLIHDDALFMISL